MEVLGDSVCNRLYPVCYNFYVACVSGVSREVSERVLQNVGPWCIDKPMMKYICQILCFRICGKSTEQVYDNLVYEAVGVCRLWVPLCDHDLGVEFRCCG